MTYDMNASHTKPGPGNNLLFPFIMIASLFFIWGFCHAMLEVLNRHFQNILHVSKTQSGFVQTSVFSAYFLLALPSALLIRRIGYKGGILLGLLVVAIGAFLFIPAGLWFKTFWSFLLALFVLSSGLACIETAANPYVTVLGPRDGAAGRLSVAQAFNSIAYILAPTVGGILLFSKDASNGPEVDFHSLLLPYIVLGCVVLVVFAVFSFIRLPDIQEPGGITSDANDASAHQAPLIRQPHFVWGIVTQFLYIVSQIGMFAYAVNYILENAVTIANGKEVLAQLFAWYGSITGAKTHSATAAYVMTFANILYAAGRFTGAPIARVIKPHFLLACYGIFNCLLLLVIIADIKHVSWMILPLCWLFMSIMFPFIFAMSLRNLGAKTKVGASIQIMSIVGGAIAGPLMGWLADTFGMAISFALPLIGFIATAIYGFAYPRLLGQSARAASAAMGSQSAGPRG